MSYGKLSLLLMGCFALSAVDSHAEIYKCLGETGNIILRDVPCLDVRESVPSHAAGNAVMSIPVSQRISFASSPALMAGLQSLRRLRIATEIGLSQRDYAQQMIDAKALIDVAMRIDTDEIGKTLQTALMGVLRIYIDALTVWRMIDNRGSITRKELARFRHTYEIFNGRLTKEETLAKIWFLAKFHLDKLDMLVE